MKNITLDASVPILTGIYRRLSDPEKGQSVSLQYEQLKAWNKLEARMKDIKAKPDQYWSGRITAYFRMKLEVYSALFFFHIREGR